MNIQKVIKKRNNCRKLQAHIEETIEENKEEVPHYRNSQHYLFLLGIIFSQPSIKSDKLNVFLF